MDNPFAVIIERLDSFGEKLDKAISENQNEHGLDRFRYMRIDEAAEKLGVKVSTMYTYTRAKKIKHYKRGAIVYFDVEDLNEFIEFGKVEPKGAIRRS